MVRAAKTKRANPKNYRVGASYKHAQHGRDNVPRGIKKEAWHDKRVSFRRRDGTRASFTPNPKKRR